VIGFGIENKNKKAVIVIDHPIKILDINLN
jgi:hypothetical protein